MHEPCEVFISYSRADEKMRQQLEKHLIGLKRQGLLRGWHDRMILPGTSWSGEIDGHLDSAAVILLLISKDFLASDYCYEIEMRRALDRHASGEACVIPIILKPVVLDGQPFASIQGLPRDEKPITTWKNRDEAFADVARGIGAAIKDLRDSGGECKADALETIMAKRDGAIGSKSTVMTETNSMDIELTIKERFDSFSLQHQKQLLGAIRSLLKTDRPIRVVRKRPGSIKLTLRLLPDEAERLLWAVRRGELANFRVVEALVAEPRPVEPEEQHMSKTMTKAAIIGHVSQKTDLSKKQVNDVMDQLLALATKEAKNVFVLPNFGRLVLANRKARLGRNPQTGEPVKIPAKRVVKFRLAKSLKDSVLGKK